jgi:hypothetical protein
MNANIIAILTIDSVVILAAFLLLKAPGRIQVARRWLIGGAWVQVSAVAILLAVRYLSNYGWVLEALGRGATLALVMLTGLGALWLLRSRLRPRGFTATSRRYANYKRVQP